MTERTGVLINRLSEQYNNKADAGQVKLSAQMLLAELQNTQPETTDAYAKVSVIFPFTIEILNEEIFQKEEHQPQPQPETKPEVTKEFSPQADEEAQQPAPETQPEKKHEALILPEAEEAEDLQPIAGYESLMEIPTLALKQQEINDAVTANSESLNDKLKAKSSYKDVGSTIKEAPVRDLRKAIGINDRFVFVNELFRGDQTMYERSIKTINGFNIYGEAEYWIKRELKLKLGWDDKKEAVQMFDELVKRRFS